MIQWRPFLRTVGVKISGRGLCLFVFGLTYVLGGIFSPAGLWAVETGTLVEKDGKYVFVESQDPTLKLLLDRALKHGWVTQEEYDRVVKESEARAYLLQPSFKVWYDRGFNFSMNNNAFFLKIRARVMSRFTQSFRNDAWRDPGDAKNFPELRGVFGDFRANRFEGDSANFNLRRVRLYFMGHLFSPDFKYFLQLSADTPEAPQTAGSGSVKMEDMILKSTHIPWLNVQLGQYKVFFNRAQINSTASMQFTERALVMNAFTASGLDRRDIGITIMNDESAYPINYYFGVFNGTGPGFTRLGAFFSEGTAEGCPGGQFSGTPPAGCEAANRNVGANLRLDSTNLLLVSRLQWNIMGRPGYAEGDMAYSDSPQMALGGGFAWNPAIQTSTNNAFIGVDVSNLGIRRQLAANGNGRQLGWGVVDFATWTLDYTVKYRGWSLVAEYYFKNVNRHNKGLPLMSSGVFAPGQLGNSTGWYVQTGYFLVPRRLQLAGRYAYWDPDTNSADDLIKQADVALTYYFNDTYDHQLTLEWSNIAMGTGGFSPGRSAPLPGPPVAAAGSFGTVPLDATRGTLIENLVRVQYQIFF